MDDVAERYFLRLAAAFVLGKRGTELVVDRCDNLSEEQCVEVVKQALDSGLRLHRFKKTMGLARVSRVLGTLKAFAPSSLLDIGSGRGAFLWPLLYEFPWMKITAVDLRSDRIDDIKAVAKGGFGNLEASVMDARSLDFPDASFDVVTMLEVLEHMPSPELALQEAIRVASRAVIISVPSHEDDNPEHIHLLDHRDLETMIKPTGCRVSFDYVLNHCLATVTKKQDSCR